MSANTGKVEVLNVIFSEFVNKISESPMHTEGIQGGKLPGLSKG